MALRAMYKGFKKVLAPLIIKRPGTLAIDQDALNTELNKVFFPRSEQSVLGTDNSLIYPYRDTTKTSHKATFTDNGDGTITVVTDGATDADATFLFHTENDAGMRDYMKSLGKKWLLGGLSEDICLYISNYDGSHTAIDSGDGAEFTFTNQNTGFQIGLFIKSGTNISTPITIYPHISESKYSVYGPYAMTNKQLTDEVGVIENSISVKTYTNMSIAEICAAIKGTSARGMKGFAFGTITGLPTLTTGFGIAIWDNSFSSGYVQVIASYQSTTESAYVQLPAGRDIPEATREATPEEVTPEEEPVVKKTSTRKKSTAKADTEKEGE